MANDLRTSSPPPHKSQLDNKQLFLQLKLKYTVITQQVAFGFQVDLLNEF